MQLVFQCAAIAGTLGLLWATLRALQRFRSEKLPAARVQIRQRVPVANGCQLVVVNWDGQDLLLATGTQACTLVAAKPAAAAPPPPEVSVAWAR